MLTSKLDNDFRQKWRPTQEKVDLAVKKAVEIAKPSRVFVFGSWARREAKIDSDLDLAVFLPDERRGELGLVRKELRRNLEAIPMSIDLIVSSEGHAAEFVSSVNSIYYKILRHGELVYDGRRK